MFRPLQRPARMLISAAIHEWYMAISHLTPATQQYYKRIVRDFVAAIPNKSVSKLSSADIRNYLQQILWSHKKSSMNNHLTAIRSFCSFLVEKHNLPNPAEKIHRLRPDPFHQPFITKGQYDKILASATLQQQDVIQLLAMTGLRASELASLEYENITENFSAIRFTGKGSKERTVPLNATARLILARHIKAETFINLPKNRWTIGRLCQRAGEKSHISLAPHTLRRFFASQLVSEGVSILIVSRLLGHASIQTTEIYLHLDSSYLSGATDVLDG